jgi:hypothetical protein
MQHRNINFAVKEIEPSEWRWTIYPKLGTHGKVIGTISYVSIREAVAACEKEIDAGLDQKAALQ